jgi:ankyrin repeat protein
MSALISALLAVTLGLPIAPARPVAPPQTAPALEGTVVSTRKVEVRVALDNDLYPRFGDAVEIFEEVPGVGPVSIAGTWAVVDVVPGKITVASFDRSVTAKVGQRVRIATREPRSEAQVVAGLEMLQAAGAGDLAAVRSALAAGVEVDARGRFGLTALGEAAGGGNLELVHVLLDAGADPNARGFGGMPVIAAAFDDRTGATLAALLDAGADPRAAGPMDLTLLHGAAMTGNRRAVVLLARAGADLEARTSDTPASDSVPPEMLGATPLFQAVAGGWPAAASALIALGADTGVANAQGITLTELAAQQGYEIPDRPSAVRDTVEELTMELESAITYPGVSVEEIAVLLRVGAQPNRTATVVYPALTTLIASPAEGLDVSRAAELLIDGGADLAAPGQEGRSALHWAAAVGNLEVARLLIDRGAPLDAQVERGFSEAGNTALMLAVRSRNLDVAELLLDAGADRTLRNEGGDTALDLADEADRVAVEALFRARPPSQRR